MRPASIRVDLKEYVKTFAPVTNEETEETKGAYDGMWDFADDEYVVFRRPTSCPNEYLWPEDPLAVLDIGLLAADDPKRLAYEKRRDYACSLWAFQEWNITSAEGEKLECLHPRPGGDESWKKLSNEERWFFGLIYNWEFYRIDPVSRPKPEGEITPDQLIVDADDIAQQPMIALKEGEDPLDSPDSKKTSEDLPEETTSAS